MAREFLTVTEEATLASIAEVWKSAYGSAPIMLAYRGRSLGWASTSAFIVTGVGHPQIGQWYISSHGTAERYVAPRNKHKRGLVRVLLREYFCNCQQDAVRRLQAFAGVRKDRRTE